MNIEPTGEYTVSDNGTYFGSFKIGDDGKYTYLAASRHYTADELATLLTKIQELNA